MMELGYGNAKGGRSTSIASNPRIKTYQNSLKSQIDPKAIWGYFWWNFFKINKIEENFCGFGGGKKGKSMATLDLIPYDVGGWPDLHGFTHTSGGK